MSKANKTRSVHLMIPPNLYKHLKKASVAYNTSVNDFACRLLAYHFRNEVSQDDGETCTPDSYVKLVCRMRFNAAVSSGRIRRQPCVVCGLSPAEGHHSDYTKPFEVEFLCRKHHMERHLNGCPETETQRSTGWLFPEMVG